VDALSLILAASLFLDTSVPDGCPWDKEQTHATLRAGVLEEAYEVLAAIDAGDNAIHGEELGDLLLRVVFHAKIAAKQNRFSAPSDNTARASCGNGAKRDFLSLIRTRRTEMPPLRSLRRFGITPIRS
jgi:NTP pyrophosphatase (non-canonical NTP hydrolase)